MEQARAQIGALPTSAFAPFTATNMWTSTSSARAPTGLPRRPRRRSVAEAMPNVPTLIFSGADDLRTPTANARKVAAQIPDAHLLVVPNTGHAVLEDEPTSCARKALQAMFSGGVGVDTIAPCPAGPPISPLLIPTPLAPARLADVSPAHGYHGRAGRTLDAVGLTIADFARQLTIQLLAAAAPTTSPR